MLLALLVSGCSGSTEDSGSDVDKTCAFGPSAHIDSPASGDTVAVGDTVVFSVTASSPNTDAQFLQIVWGVEGLTGEGEGVQDTAGIGASVNWMAPTAGDWRVIVQVDDECTRDPTYDTPPAQTYVDILVQ